MRSDDKEPVQHRSLIEATESVTAMTNARLRIVSLNMRSANISFFIIADSHSWLLEKVLYNDREVESVGPSIGSVLRGSYRCPQSIVFRDGETHARLFRIQGLTILPEFSDNFNFRKESVAQWTCTQYVTIPILMGLGVSIMLLGVLIFGVICIMDIRSVDRFDPAKK